jgi:hypothetical protein
MRQAGVYFCMVSGSLWSSRFFQAGEADIPVVDTELLDYLLLLWVHHVSRGYYWSFQL